MVQTGGNPLALVELPGSLSPAQLAGREPLPVDLPLTEGVQRVFLDRSRRLSVQGRRPPRGARRLHAPSGVRRRGVDDSLAGARSRPDPGVCRRGRRFHPGVVVRQAATCSGWEPVR
ncbi:MAG TPA: hypothetical protein VIU11_19155 [Nakamurella sp.]